MRISGALIWMAIAIGALAIEATNLNLIFLFGGLAALLAGTLVALGVPTVGQILGFALAALRPMRFLFVACSLVLGSRRLPLAVIAALASCAPPRPLPAPDTGAPPAAPSYWPTHGWRDTTPESQGMSSRQIAAAIDSARFRGIAIHSLLIARHGYVVTDASFYPFPSTSRHDVASVAKSVTSILAGIAIRVGLIHPEDDVWRRLGASAPSQPITLEHLLAMRSGLQCGPENHEAQLHGMMRSTNWVRYALTLQVDRPPDSQFSYCSPNYHLISALVQEAAREPSAAFARQHLFEPLGIGNVYWPADPQGVTHGWGDLQVTARDLAKLGLLFLQRGRWNGEQIVDSGWVRRSVTPRSRYGDADYYGLGWWTHQSSPPGFYEAIGRGGQRLSIWPEKDIVVVMTGGGFEPGVVGGMIMRALVSDVPLAADTAGYARLGRSIAAAALPQAPTTQSSIPPMASAISAREYSFPQNAMGLQSLVVRFGENVSEASATLALTDRVLQLVIGLDGLYRVSPTLVDSIAPLARGAWNSSGDFILELNLVGKIDRYTMTLHPENDLLRLRIQEATGLVSDEIVGRATGR